jgi:ribulose kinase
MEKISIGTDVGTRSVRVGAFDRTGKLRGKAEHPIRIWMPKPEYVEQSSEDIWKATCKAMRACLHTGRINPKSVGGISFDATCSLVAIGEGFQPLTVSPTKKAIQNIIVWMDHRAIPQADFINKTGHEVLKYVGGEDIT